jgi:hypothetical protein
MMDIRFHLTLLCKIALCWNNVALRSKKERHTQKLTLKYLQYVLGFWTNLTFYGGLDLGSGQFLILSQLLQKTMLASKVVNYDSKGIILLQRSKIPNAHCKHSNTYKQTKKQASKHHISKHAVAK